MTDMKNVKNKKIRISKFDRRTALRNFWYTSQYRKDFIFVIGRHLDEAFSISPDGLTKKRATVIASHKYYVYSAYAIIRNEVFVFGGSMSYRTVRK